MFKTLCHFLVKRGIPSSWTMIIPDISGNIANYNHQSKRGFKWFKHCDDDPACPLDKSLPLKTL